MTEAPDEEWAYTTEPIGAMCPRCDWPLPDKREDSSKQAEPDRLEDVSPIKEKGS